MAGRGGILTFSASILFQEHVAHEHKSWASDATVCVMKQENTVHEYTNFTHS